MPMRDSHKGQQKKMKKGSNAIGQDRDYGNDLAEKNHNERMDKGKR
ncbi:hypothetical protein ACFSCX_24530 [Bacillus salitolerans]|uniref:YpzI family protein n=1 Tax=Bacillus salitolerans TaxID=1437434 RepID=A0ABW4LWT4_9BACI